MPFPTEPVEGATYSTGGWDPIDYEFDGTDWQQVGPTALNGSIHLDTAETPVWTDFADATTPVKLLVTTYDPGTDDGFTTDTSGRLVYVGTPGVGEYPRYFSVCVSLTSDSDAPNSTFRFYVARNGEIQLESRKDVKFTTANDERGVTLLDVTRLDIGDYIEVYAVSPDQASLRVDGFSMVALGV